MSEHHHDHQQDRSKEGIRFQWIVLVVGIALCGMKFFGFWITSSVSILTDAIESIVNVLAATVGLYALYISSKPRDRDHPFGHGNVELLSSTFEGGLIAAAGGIIICESFMRILNPEPLTDLTVGITIVAIALVANFIVGYGAIAKGKKNNSPALVASGKHLCSDSLSSVGILIGLGIIVVLDKFFNIEALWIDGVVALIFGVIILYVGAKVVYGSIGDTMGKIDESVIDKVVGTLNEHRHEHWVDVHALRVMKIGPTYHVDIHVVFPGTMTIDEQQNEIAEVLHSFHDIYGDSVDLTIMGDSCNKRHCTHCNFECSQRVEAFVEIKQWTVDSVCEPEDTMQ